MGTRPRVGVTGDSKRLAPSWWCLSLALRIAGAIPERITTRHAPSGQPLDALIVSGGNDIGPELYGGADMPKAKIDGPRDELEIRWINHALENNTPLLGICRGAQLINAVLGGTLHQDIRHLRKRTTNRALLLPLKNVAVAGESRLAEICGRSRLRVNSLHHQAIRRTGKGLMVVGRDQDHFCQAIESTEGRPLIGVQWHPEYLFFLPSHFALFRWLLRYVK